MFGIYFHTMENKDKTNKKIETSSEEQTTQVGSFYSAGVKKIDGSRIEITVEISAEVFDKHYDRALQKIKNEAELPGFRKGHVPEKIIIEKWSAHILDEAAESSVSEIYPKIITENKIDTLGTQEITITKSAKGNPLLFKMVITVMPEFVLPDYKNIAGQLNKNKTDPKNFEATEKDLEDVVMQIRMANRSKEDLENKNKTEKAKPPALSDEMVKKLGAFENVADFYEKLKKNIRDEKEYKDKEKKRAEIIEEIVKKSSMDLRDVVIESELARMVAQFRGDVERMGMKPEDYLKHTKKTEEDLKKEWRGDAEKRAKTQIILNKIAVVENLKPDEEKVKKEVEHLSIHHKDADQSRIKNYVETVLLNEKVLDFLTSQN